MGIILTFDKCLNSPYLLVDPTAPQRCPTLLSQAEERLNFANRLFNNAGDPADICLFAYESMFASLRALVYIKGYREAGLRCLLAACNQLWVQPGTLDPALLFAFEKAQRMVLSPTDALAAATEWLDRARSAAQEPSTTTSS